MEKNDVSREIEIGWEKNDVSRETEIGVEKMMFHVKQEAQAADKSARLQKSVARLRCITLLKSSRPSRSLRFSQGYTPRAASFVGTLRVVLLLLERKRCFT